jgi:hypothetical protein
MIESMIGASRGTKLLADSSSMRAAVCYSAGEFHNETLAASHNRNGATINICPLVTTLFKGRQRILEQLDAYFSPRSSGEYRQREFLLHGMGGSGKSQIALKFAELSEQRYV